MHAAEAQHSCGRLLLQVFPRVASRPPRLLQELEALLVDRLRSADKAASVTQLLPKDRDPRMAANLSLDVHRQVGQWMHAQLHTWRLTYLVL